MFCESLSVRFVLTDSELYEWKNEAAQGGTVSVPADILWGLANDAIEARETLRRVRQWIESSQP